MGQRIRWWLEAIAVGAFVLLPFAWSLIELLPAIWNYVEAAHPETSAVIWQWGANAVVWAWRQWMSLESYRIGVVVIAFLVATAGSYYGGPYRKYFCGVFYSAGLAVLGYILHVLSVQEWAMLTLAASDISAIVPSVSAFVGDWFLWLSKDLSAEHLAGAKVIGILFVIAYGALSWAFVRGRIAEIQEVLQSAFIGQVDPVFPRANLRTAEACAEGRRLAIEAYLQRQKLPPQSYSQVSFSNGSSPFRLVREYIERRQEIVDVNPLHVAAFLEVPKGSPIKAKHVTLETAEEVAGQFVRLLFELKREPPPPWPKHSDPPDDMFQLLLGRVVDAAVLADQHFDALREDTSWNAMPFFDRIYLDYRPIPPPLECFLGPLLGNALPARVVIETHYPDIFRKALYGGKGKYGQFRNWFGIGIQIEQTNLRQSFFSRFWRGWGFKTKPVLIERTTWFNAPVPCRRMKSRIAGGISGKLKLNFSIPSLVQNQPPSEGHASLHVMSCGPLADGCPSVFSSRPPEPPIVNRGGVSNAPAMWLLPTRSELHRDCKSVCVKSVPGETETITVDLSNAGTVHNASSELFSRYKGPPSVGQLRGRAWVGAFFDRELRQASRFPLLACSKKRGDGGYSGWYRADLRPDLRGAFVRRKTDKLFGGVFVATQGPEHASNLLLPEPLLNDYLTHLPLANSLADMMPQVEEPPFVPKPEIKRAR